MITVIKRDCSISDFDIKKIEKAILKSMPYGNGVDKIVALSIATDIQNQLSDNGINEVSIYDIEDMVYIKLCERKHELTAKAYEGYRAIQSFKRQANTTDVSIEELLGGNSEYWNTENSNKNSKVVTTQRDYLAGITSTDISRRILIPSDIIQAHDDGIIHFHDIDYFAQKALTNCELINLEDMLQNGTMINNVMIEKPKRLLTAMTIATQIITAVTSSTYGGASITLTHLAPFVRDSYNVLLAKYRARGLSDEVCEKFAKEDLDKEIKDGVQTFNYQINSMSNTNGQSPFLTVFMYLGENSEYTHETSLLTREFLKQRTLGMKNEKGIYVSPAFPKLIYVTEESNINEDSKYWDLTILAAKCTAKRLVPDYISEKKMKELKEGNCFPVMGCRSALSPYKDENGNYKFYGRFNCGVVTLSLPDVALSSMGNMDMFWNLLEERAELCHKALLVRYNRLKDTLSDVAPILWQHGALARLKKGETINSLLHGGYSSISLGYAGLYECIKYMTGNSHTDGSTGEKLAIDVMTFLNNKCEQWKAEDDLGYGIYGSPIESTTYKFAKCLKKRFGVIEGITDRDYITNSYHVPVFETIDPFTKLSLEGKFQALSTGGAISYIETGNLTNNIQAVLSVIKYIHNNIMYAELNTKSDYCQVCGFDGEILIDENMEWCCPNCKNKDQTKMNILRRTCGYCGANYFNKGRTQEIKERYVHLDNHDQEV